MSKYVRTKDGKIASLCGFQDHITDCTEEKVLYLSARHNPLCVYRIPYVKQADTIEELCDKFVWVDDNYHDDCQRGFICNIEFAKNCTKMHKGRLYGNSKFIFGAIWTDKGLIYVAKMNEKGEFELL